MKTDKNSESKTIFKKDRNLHLKLTKKFKLQIYERKKCVQVKIAF